MKIGSAIRQAREALGITQSELGERANVSRVHVVMLEGDRKQPTIEVFVRLAQALKMRPSTLMARAERLSGE